MGWVIGKWALKGRRDGAGRGRGGGTDILYLYYGFFVQYNLLEGWRGGGGGHKYLICDILYLCYGFLSSITCL